MLNDFILAEIMNKDFQPDFAAWREKEDNQELVRKIVFGYVGDESYVITRHCITAILTKCFLLILTPSNCLHILPHNDAFYLLQKDISFGVQVLSLGHWPSQKIKEAILPPSFESCKAFFMGW
jgi:hypothetical protein